MKSRMESRTPIKTTKQNNWAVNIWDDWAAWRNKLDIGNTLARFSIVPSINQIVEKGIDGTEIGFWLARFVLEIKRKDGKDYPPNSLYQICVSLQRFLRSCNLGNACNLHIFNENDPQFYQFCSSLGSKMKELTSNGLGVITKSASPITQEDELQLWGTGAISINTSFGLSNGVFLYNCKLFGLRGQDEHRALTREQYIFTMDPVSGRDKLSFYGRLNKNNQGGIKTRKIKPKVIDQYHDPTNPRCAVTLFKRYLEIIPKNGPFYRRPLINLSFQGTPRFSQQPVGTNKLSSYMKNMFSYAGISTEGRNISNHSGKVTLCTNVHNSGFEEQTVQQRSGHRSSDAVRLYKRPGSNMMQSASDNLQPPKPKLKSTYENLGFYNSFTETTSQTKSSTVPLEKKHQP